MNCTSSWHFTVYDAYSCHLCLMTALGQPDIITQTFYMGPLKHRAAAQSQAWVPGLSDVYFPRSVFHSLSYRGLQV